MRHYFPWFPFTDSFFYYVINGIQQQQQKRQSGKYISISFHIGTAFVYRETFYNKIIISTCAILKGKMAKIVFNLFLFYLNHFVKWKFSSVTFLCFLGGKHGRKWLKLSWKFNNKILKIVIVILWNSSTS